MQYTLRNVPKHLDRALRERAARANKSLNEAAIEALAQGLGLGERAVKRRKLDDLAGTWCDDPEFDAAIADQHRVDEELWK
jgi:plasmid stability protein